MLIGADGINGLVRSFKYSRDEDRPLNYLGMLVVLGITGDIEHFLMHDRVFQTMDEAFRLFAMPFPKCREDQSIMWQLSFPCSIELANQLSRDQQMLKDFILNQCHDWHQPIPQIIQKTQLDLIMGIPAFDRDLIFSKDSSSQDSLPIALIGDAAHPMSPFKGQGANQALLDALDFTEILKRNSAKDLYSSINEYEHRMLNRVESKVMQSRERVTTFHRPEALSTDNFLYRGVNQQLIDHLNSLEMNALWKDSSLSIEQAISNVLTKR